MEAASAAAGPSTGVESFGVVEGCAVAEAGEATVPADACLEDAETMKGRMAEEEKEAEETGAAWRKLSAEARRRQVRQIMRRPMRRAQSVVGEQDWTAMGGCVFEVGNEMLLAGSKVQVTLDVPSEF